MTDIIETGAAGASDSEPNQASIAMADLPQALREAALRLNWTELMPVQAQAIPPMLSGEDVMVQSQTGSGKTGAFLLPMLHRIDPALGAPQALVLAPTRELAVQVARDAEELGRSMGIRSLPIYGGVGYAAQIQGLEAGAQLIIGTPGRILEHLLKGTLTLDWLKMLVFDEADRMLSMGFYPDMKQLQRYLPRGLQSAMFSATYPGHVKRLAQQFLREPRFVSLSQTQVHATDVLHVVYKVPAMQKSRVLVKIIEQENPASAIIFCNTKADVHFVSVVLRRFGYDVGEISADLSQAAREEVRDARVGRAPRVWPFPWFRAWKNWNWNRSPKNFPFPWKSGRCPPTKNWRHSSRSGPCFFWKLICGRRTTSRKSGCSDSRALRRIWRAMRIP